MLTQKTGGTVANGSNGNHVGKMFQRTVYILGQCFHHRSNQIARHRLFDRRSNDAQCTNKQNELLVKAVNESKLNFSSNWRSERSYDKQKVDAEEEEVPSTGFGRQIGRIFWFFFRTDRQGAGKWLTFVATLHRQLAFVVRVRLCRRNGRRVQTAFGRFLFVLTFHFDRSNGRSMNQRIVMSRSRWISLCNIHKCTTWTAKSAWLVRESVTAELLF